MEQRGQHLCVTAKQDGARCPDHLALAEEHILSQRQAASAGRARQEEQPVHFRAQRRDGGWRGWGHVRSGCFHNVAVLKKKKKKEDVGFGEPATWSPPHTGVAFVQRCRLSFSLLVVVVVSDLSASCRHIVSPLSLFSFNQNFLL